MWFMSILYILIKYLINRQKKKWKKNENNFKKNWAKKYFFLHHYIHTVQYVYGTELVHCSNKRQHRGSPFGARKVFTYYSCIGTGHVQMCVCRALLISLPAQHSSTATRWVPTRKLMMVLKILGTATHKYILYTV